MRTTERQTSRPIGLARFLVSHGECAEGYETIRDRGLITVICRGCDASFSFLTRSPEDSRKEVEEALVELAEASGPDRPARNGSAGEAATASPQPSNGAAAPPTAPREKPIHTPPLDASANGLSVAASSRRHRLVRPAGPLAPRHNLGPNPFERLARSFERGGRRLVAAVDHRRRPIALAALGLTGAYLLLGLTLGDESSSSRGNGSLGGTPVPVTTPATTPPAATPAAPATDQGAVAASVRPLQTFEAGGPELQDVVIDDAQFRVALPPDWGSSLGLDGRTLLGPTAGGAEIQVVARPRGDLSISEMADEATALLAEGLPPGYAVSRLAAQPMGNLVQVARSSNGAVETAYVGLGTTTAYTVISHVRKDATALVQMQAQGVIASFEAD